jgi:signal transduction histidine kinase
MTIAEEGPELPGLLPAALLARPEDGRPPARSPRDRIVDVVVLVLAAGVGAVLFFTQPDVETAPAWLVLADLVAGVVSILALWWRRRWPVQLTVVTSVLSVFSALGGVAAAIMLFTAAVHRRTGVVAGLAGLSLAAGLAFTVVRPDHGTSPWVQVALSVLVVAVVVAWGMVVRARRQLVHSLQDRAARAEAEQRLRIDQARQHERLRIAREMHDVLAHRISLVSLHAGALEYRSDASPADIARSAAVIRASAHQALQDLRDLLGVLRAEVAEGDDQTAERPQPTLDDLPRLIEDARSAGMNVRLDSSVPVPDVPAGIGRTAYRTVQEGLTNAAKHAPGTAVVVRLTGAAGPGLAVEVCNSRLVGGPGPRAAAPEIPGAGQGLTGLTERAAIAGGRLEHGRTPSGDFRLAAWLPWPA